MHAWQPGAPGSIRCGTPISCAIGLAPRTARGAVSLSRLRTPWRRGRCSRLKPARQGRRCREPPWDCQGAGQGIGAGGSAPEGDREPRPGRSLRHAHRHTAPGQAPAKPGKAGPAFAAALGGTPCGRSANNRPKAWTGKDVPVFRAAYAREHCRRADHISVQARGAAPRTGPGWPASRALPAGSRANWAIPAPRPCCTGRWPPRASVAATWPLTRRRRLRYVARDGTARSLPGAGDPGQ